VIHRSDGTRWACSTIEHTEPVMQARAFFDGPLVRGEVLFTQLADSPLAETTMFWNFEQDFATTGHKWHVHTSSVRGGDCVAAGGHFNPTQVCTTSLCNYSTTCGLSDVKQFNCELGDLSGKHGLLNIPSSGLVTDLYLPLSGIDTIVDCSIVIHSKNGSADRLACTNIKAYKGRPPGRTCLVIRC